MLAHNLSGDGRFIIEVVKNYHHAKDMNDRQ